MDLSISQLNQISISRYGMELDSPPAPQQTGSEASGPEIEGHPAEQPPRASQTELNRLMQTLARESYSELNATDLLKQTKKLATADKQELRELSDRASNALQAIKDLKVRELTDSTDDRIEQLFNTAADLQFELANKLRELANSVNGRTRKFRGYPQMLNELSLKCDARGSELLTLYMEVRTFGQEGAIGKDSAFSSATAGDLLKGMAGSMHGNDKAQLLEAETTALEANLAKIGTKTKVVSEDIVGLCDQAKALSTSLKKPDVALTMDPTLHAKLTDRLDNLFKELIQRAKGIAKHATAELFRREIPLNELGRMAGEFVATHKKSFPSLHKFFETVKRFGDEGPRDAKDLLAFDDFLESDALYEDIQKYMDAKDHDFPDAIGVPIDPDKEDDELTTAFLDALGFSQRNYNMVKQVTSEMIGRQKAWGDTATTKFAGEDIVHTFRKDDTFSMIVEARINGVNEKDLRGQLSDANLIAVKQIGSGMANTVYKMTYRMEDGSNKDFVFKPDLSGRVGLHRLRVGTCAYVSTQQSVKHNTATCDVANLLGLGRLTGKNYATVHDGQYGLLMEMAPGIEANKIKHTKDPAVKEQFKDREFVGNLAKELNDLRWLDIATGQGDRHYKNYLVDLTTDPKHPRVTAIDNDMCFTPYLVGIGKFDIKHSEQRFENFETYLRAACFTTTGSTSAAKARFAALMSDIKANNYIVDTKSAPKEILSAVFNAFGYHSCSAPKQMSRALNDKLIALTDEQIEDFARQQAANLDGDDALKATVNRLKELRELAIAYKNQGLVVEDDDWASNDEVLHRELDTEIELNDHSPAIDGDAHHITASMLNREFGKLAVQCLKP